MNREEIKQLTDDQLLKEKKQRKPNFVMITISMVGMVILAILNTYSRGIGVFTFLPGIFLPIATKHWSINKLIKQEIHLRRLR